MEEKLKKLIKPGVMFAILCFVVLCLIEKPSNIDDVISYIGYVAVAVTLVFILYTNFLWKYNPFEKLPRIEGEYIGKIKYDHFVKGEKSIDVSIKQTLFYTRVITRTDGNKSKSITADIVLENDEYSLYYIYITNPDGVDIKKNPIQYGACKIDLSNDKKLSGIYWTTQSTIGDIELIKKE